MRLAILLLSALLCFPSTLTAAVDVRDFSSELEERRYRALVAELRCPKCQNTNLAGSDQHALKAKPRGLPRYG